jgi:hypothetical protein
MAKLSITLDVDCITDRSMVSEDYSAKQIEVDRLFELCEKMDKSKLGLLVGATSDEYQVDFLFYPKCKGKASILTIDARGDGKGFEVKAKGEFMSQPLKAGVVKYLEPVMNQLDLRLKAVIYDGGMYSGADGLTSWMEGGDYEEITESWARTFPLVSEWKFV